jgi:hypothetical protein
MMGATGGVRDGTVEMDFGVQHGNSWGACVSRVVEAVASNGAANAMGLFFVWADAADIIRVCNFSLVRDFVFLDEESCVGAINALAGGSVGLNALAQVSEFVGGASSPFRSVGSLSEGGEGLFVAGGRVADVSGDGCVDGCLG